jgi:hypothetical protein
MMKDEGGQTRERTTRFTKARRDEIRQFFFLQRDGEALGPAIDAPSSWASVEITNQGRLKTPDTITAA